jgi:hypothetical protein
MNQQRYMNIDNRERIKMMRKKRKRLKIKKIMKPKLKQQKKKV